MRCKQHKFSFLISRQLCVSETRNLNISTQQSTQQNDLETCKDQLKQLHKEKSQCEQENLHNLSESKTLKERLLIAELEISKLKSEHAIAENQKR